MTYKVTFEHWFFKQLLGLCDSHGQKEYYMRRSNESLCALKRAEKKLEQCKLEHFWKRLGLLNSLHHHMKMWKIFENEAMNAQAQRNVIIEDAKTSLKKHIHRNPMWKLGPKYSEALILIIGTGNKQIAYDLPFSP